MTTKRDCVLLQRDCIALMLDMLSHNLSNAPACSQPHVLEYNNLTDAPPSFNPIRNNQDTINREGDDYPVTPLSPWKPYQQ